jgi:hypothetical protein
LYTLQSGVGQALQYFQEKVRLRFISYIALATLRGYFIQVYQGAITDDDADDIENHFYDLPTTMKRRNRHVPLGNGGGVRLVNLPDLHRGAGLRVSPASFIYPSKLASEFFSTLSLMAL